MAIVKTEKVIILGKEFTKKFKCSSSGVFSLDLPLYIVTDIGIKTIEGESLSKVEEEFYKKIEEYETSEKKERKIIVLSLALKGTSINPKTNDRAEQYNDWSSGSKSVNISTSKCKVLIECEINGHKNYYKEYTDMSGEIQRQGTSGYGVEDSLVIEWTEEREEYIKSIIKALRIILFQLGEFRNLKPKEIENIIDQGQKLLGDTNN